jgi:predicted nucleic acid-binding protein
MTADAERAIEIAALTGQRASYDSHYLALAERLGCELWTADDRFRDAARGPRVQARV